MNRRSILLTIFSAVAVSLAQPVSAQEKAAPSLESHPAVMVVKEYLKHMLAQDWEKSSMLVEEESMRTLRDDYVKRMKRSATLDEEKDIVAKFKVKYLEDLEKMAPRDFYVNYHRILKERHNVPDEVIQKVRTSMQMKVISVGTESESLAHVLVRTKHSNDRATIENLELISLIKTGEKWFVGLNEQVPRITPLPGAANDAAPPEGTPGASSAKPGTGTGAAGTPAKPASGDTKKETPKSGSGASSGGSKPPEKKPR
jgi:hypothetical protein